MKKIKSFTTGRQHIQGIKRKLLLSMILALVFIFIAAFFSTVAAGQEPLSVKIGAYANQPKIFMDADGVISGFWPDLMEHIAKTENWKIKYVWGTWNEGLDHLINKEIDIMPDVAFTEKRNKLYAFSEAPVLMSWTRVYVNEENEEIQSMLDLKNKKIAALKGSVNLEGAGGLREIALGFNLNCTFLELDDYTEVFKAVEENRGDAGITNRNFGNKNAKNFKVKKTPIIFQPINMKFAFPKDAESTRYLAGRINYHIKQLKQDENSVYYQLLEEYFEAEIAEKEVFPKWLSAALKIIAALFILCILVIIATRIQVKRKTSEVLSGREALQMSEERYRSVFENTGTATVILTEDMTISMANSEFEKLSGYSRKEIEGKKKWTEFVVEEDLEWMKEYATERRKNGGKAPTEYDFRFDNKRDSVKDIFLKIGMIPGTKKSVASLMDITDRKKAEREIKHLNLVLSAIRNVNQLVVTEKDRGRLIQGACDNLTETRGYYSAWIVLFDDAGRYAISAESGLGKGFLPMVEMLKGGEFTTCGRNALSQQGVVVIENPASTCTDCPFVDIHHGEAAMIIRLEYGEKIYGLLSVYIPPDFALNEEEQGLFKEVAEDIAFALHGIDMEAEREKIEDQIKRSLREKESLLAEIHHRVKNNMQIITSLLSLQSKDIEDERSLALIKNCEDRIMAMSLIHEKLYLSKDLSQIDFHDYMEDLSALLFQTCRVDSRNVSFSSHIKNISFNIETAIPLGLIANELISNAMKYAFPEGRKGKIVVELTQNRKTEEYTLTVTDDGIGIPEGIDYKNPETFGLQLVDMLTEQLSGTMELDRSKEGTSFKIIFNEQKYRKRI
ncbi:MAG: hypothetical protein SRB1_03060 [Desulfobacteraceae bacterium Eth-SRB1]|nr:MAG: hypothetical protein SRB1_03060 [Desulfobacteraceae bacterium Eth-SRB1]